MNRFHPYSSYGNIIWDTHFYWNFGEKNYKISHKTVNNVVDYNKEARLPNITTFVRNQSQPLMIGETS
jgi:hypothetical protein